MTAEDLDARDFAWAEHDDRIVIRTYADDPEQRNVLGHLFISEYDATLHRPALMQHTQPERP